MSLSIVRTALFLFSCFFICSAEQCTSDPEEGFPCDDGFDVEPLSDIRYGPTEDARHMLDFYKPTGDVTEARPLILFLHPGAFILGDKADFLVGTIAKDFARCGYATASVNYTLITDMADANTILETISELEPPVKRQLYDAIRDVRTAIRFFKANAQTYHIDPNRIYLVGYSAGATIALNIAFLDENEASRFFTKSVAAGEGECLDCIPYVGEPHPRKFNASVKGIVAINGALFDISCVSDADASDTPTLLVYSDNDEVIPTGEGKPYQKMLDKKNIELNLPYIAFELAILESKKTKEIKKTTVRGLDPSIVLPKWMPKIAASSVTPKVYGSKAILRQLKGKYKHKLEFKGGHNFISDPETGDLNANYEKLCREAKSFFIKAENKSQRKKKEKHRNQ